MVENIEINEGVLLDREVMDAYSNFPVLFKHWGYTPDPIDAAKLRHYIREAINNNKKLKTGGGYVSPFKEALFRLLIDYGIDISLIEGDPGVGNSKEWSEALWKYVTLLREKENKI